jgi:hypothetical protein
MGARPNAREDDNVDQMAERWMMHCPKHKYITWVLARAAVDGDILLYHLWPRIVGGIRRLDLQKDLTVLKHPLLVHHPYQRRRLRHEHARLVDNATH